MTTTTTNYKTAQIEYLVEYDGGRYSHYQTITVELDSDGNLAASSAFRQIFEQEEIYVRNAMNNLSQGTWLTIVDSGSPALCLQAIDEEYPQDVFDNCMKIWLENNPDWD